MSVSKEERLKAALAERDKAEQARDEADRARDVAYRAWVKADRKVRAIEAEP